jgi:hypothetical protein
MDPVCSVTGAGSEVRVAGPIYGVLVRLWDGIVVWGLCLHWTHPTGDNEPPGALLQASVDDGCERCDADDDGGVA